jgi:hypothetical protein
MVMTSSCLGNDISERLLWSIAEVESGNCDSPRGSNDNGEAVGRFQLHKKYVTDVNRIVGYRKYSFNDRKDGNKSREMTRIYLTYWTRHNGLKFNDNFNIVRLHNGGPNGHKIKSTIEYARKVMLMYNSKKG